MQVSGHCAPNLHAHVGAAVPNLRHVEYFHDHQRIERLFFDGALDPAGGTLRPDPDRPGHGLTQRHADTERYLAESAANAEMRPRQRFVNPYGGLV